MSQRTSAQQWDAQVYQTNTPFVAEYGNDVLALLDPQPHERILDLGCGDGVLTRRIMASGATVTGVDASEDFAAAAREAGVDARVLDVQRLDYTSEFDAVFSNAVLHWVPDHAAVARGVNDALVSGGRFVGEFGGFGNIAAIATALRAAARRWDGDVADAAPYNNPTPEEFAEHLSAAGLVVDDVHGFARPTPLPTGMRGWLETMRGTYLDGFGDNRDAALEFVLDMLEPSLKTQSGQWYADYVRLRFVAHKP